MVNHCWFDGNSGFIIVTAAAATATIIVDVVVLDNKISI